MIFNIFRSSFLPPICTMLLKESVSNEGTDRVLKAVKISIVRAHFCRFTPDFLLKLRVIGFIQASQNSGAVTEI